MHTQRTLTLAQHQMNRRCRATLRCECIVWKANKWIEFSNPNPLDFGEEHSISLSNKSMCHYIDSYTFGLFARWMRMGRKRTRWMHTHSNRREPDATTMIIKMVLKRKKNPNREPYTYPRAHTHSRAATASEQKKKNKYERRIQCVGDIIEFTAWRCSLRTEKFVTIYAK